MMQDEKAVCFSGHRSVSMQDEKITETITNLVKAKINEGYTSFYVGGAIGFDMLCAIVVADLKRNGEKIKLNFVLPCYNYSKNWSEFHKGMQKILLEYADSVKVISRNYSPSCMFERNRYMVDRSDCCICYMNETKGGTAYTVNYAKRKNLEIINAYE